MPEVPPQYSVFLRLLLHRLKENRDLKIIITSRSATTGLGKTTLAYIICREIMRIQGREWTTDDHAFIDVQGYRNAYINGQEGDCLLLDEIEYAADSRRAMSSDNVDLSHTWTTLRYKNIVSVATLPTTTMLDGRLLELADVWINVTRKGVAHPYYLWVNDYTGERNRKRMVNELGLEETIAFNDVSDEQEWQKLKQLKEDHVEGDENQYFERDDLESAKDDAQRAEKIHLTNNLLANTNLNQSEIANIVERSQQWVSKVNTGDVTA